jgi:Rrf2 family transcriptional regulator, cysteine metabolism repressor
MKLSTKSRYASRALIELALKYGKGPVKLKDVSERQNISLKYLEQVMFPLRVSGYVKTLKGSQGGYVLSRPPGNITLLEIVECIEGPIAPVDCVNNAGLCERAEKCVTREAWVNLKDAIRDELGKIKLSELVENHKSINS